MRILYLSVSYVPSRRASSVHAMKMCAALSRAGHRVTLLTKRCPARQEPGVADDFAFYGVEQGFALARLGRPAWRGGGAVWAARVRRYLRRHRAAIDLVYARDPVGAWLAARLGLRVVFEAHAPPRGSLRRAVWRRLVSSTELTRLVVISDALARELRQRQLLPERLEPLVAHDAADPMPIEPAPPGVHSGRPRLGYVGQLYPGKGGALLRRLAAEMSDCAFHVVGGSEPDLDRARKADATPNLVYEGFVPPAELVDWYRGFDLLLLPCGRRVEGASGGEIARWMSPMKLFEYLAAGRAIVSSDLPVLREVLEHEGNALLVPPEDIAAWGGAVRRLLADPELAGRLAQRAQADLLARHTWDARAKEVLSDL